MFGKQKRDNQNRDFGYSSNLKSKQHVRGILKVKTRPGKQKQKQTKKKPDQENQHMSV